MKQTKELLMSKKWILAMVLLLATAFFVMQKGVLAKADSANEEIEKNGVIYTLFTEKEFEDSDYYYYLDWHLEAKKLKKVLSLIRAKGSIYVATGYNGTNRAVTIENTINGKPVMLVFLEYNSNKITSMKIPANVVYFEVNGLDDIKQVNVSSDNKMLSSKDGVVYDKNKTTLFYYPPAKTNKTYKMPKTVKSIQDSVFMRQKYLEKLVMSDKVTVIPTYFADGAKKLKSVQLPKKLKKMEMWAFEDCKKLKKVTIPSTLKEMNRPFAGCKMVVTIKSKKFKMDMDVANYDNKSNTFIIKKGTQINCCTNSQDGINSKTNSILSIKKKDTNGFNYTIKALKTGKSTVECNRDKLNFKVVK